MTRSTERPAVSGHPEKPPRSRRGLRRVLLGVLAVAAGALAAVVLVNSSDELLAAGDTLTALDWRWLVVAVVAEVLSYGLRGAAQALVLRRGATSTGQAAAQRSPDPCRTDTDAAAPADPERVAEREPSTPGLGVLSAATWAGDAAAYCLPFGFAVFGVVAVRALRRRGVSTALATWTFAVAQVFYLASVAVLTVVAVQIAGDQDPIPGLEQATYGLLIALVVLVGGSVLLRRSRAGVALRGTVAAWWARRRAANPGHPAARGRAWTRLARWWRAQTEQLRAVRLPPAAAAAVFGLMLGSWLTDIAVLGIAYAALGAGPPWAGLLLAYCAGQIVSAVPVTPGGIGVVEGSLTLALVAFGGAETLTLAAVLLYRLITYWGCIPVGALAWLALRLTGRGAPGRTTAPARQTLEAGSS